MPPRLTEQERRTLLADQHVGVLSVARGERRPSLTIPIWYGHEPGGDVTFFSGVGTRKIELIRTAGVASLCVQQEQPPYKYVTVEGTVTRMDRPPTAEQLLAIARRYLPEDRAQGMVAGSLADGGHGLVLVTIRPDRWLSADFSGEAD